MDTTKNQPAIGNPSESEDLKVLRCWDFSVFDEIDNLAVWDTSAIQHAYKCGTNPYDWASTNLGIMSRVGTVASVENELLDIFQTQLATDGNYYRLYTPQFASTGITFYQNMPLVWVWLTDGTHYFYKEQEQVYFGSLTSNFYPVPDSSSAVSGGPLSDFQIIAIEIAEEMQQNNYITFPVGGAVKIYNSTTNTWRIYLCSMHTADTTKHPGDFPIFLTWALYQTPIVTDDHKKLARDLKANGALVYHIV